MFIRSINLMISVLLLSATCLFSTEKKDDSKLWSDKTFAGLKLRSIGPAFMSGRIADIAIHPEDDNIWYVAVGSGGVWKTKNAGVTWTPIFDDQKSYSIGCVTIDPNNPHTIWVGTGENVGGRHVGYGDGVYRSKDAGKSWENMGLKESQHIARIIVHPKNSNIIWVAAQGPLWSKGGERGLYKSIDGGKNWKRTLGDNEWVGVTELVMDPRNPDWLYAATWQRHRNVAAYMGGGFGSGLHRSVDGGETWEKLTKGLPEGNMGKIGLAVSPQKPDIVYAAIELDRTKGAVYRSEDRGSSWEKRSDTVSGGTGPHYYQELYASPHQFDLIYLMNWRMLISEDGGKTFNNMQEKYKHSDNHAIAFRPDDPDYLLVGTDGGLYESFDLAENWRFVANLPITQFYKVALDDAEPFYNIYGGTQDNNTQGGPSRTKYYHGIRNADWRVTLWGDGHQPATEPGNPDIIYSEWQQGNLTRVDMTTGEFVFIQPQAEEGAAQSERYNWDAPILVSPHSATRLYFASQRVWRSDDRGDSWKAISTDLTRKQDRLTLPIMGETQSWDSPWDVRAMSNYNTITSLSESPLAEGLIYAGTDDGLILVTENDGDSWTKIEVGALPGTPGSAFVNDIKADLHDPNTVYVALDNHKYGDLEPYLFKSVDRGKKWKSMKGTLPERTLIWRIVQDHVKSNLLFTATEFGVYVTIDGGTNWSKLSGNTPTISFRDLAIQRRENDLVAASFGRGFYVFDDYSVLRDVSEKQLKQEAALFSTRKAWWYMKRPILGFGEKGAQGASHYTAPNPPFGAVFTYYLADDLQTQKERRQKSEKKQKEAKKSVVFSGWDAIEKERRQETPKILLTVKDAAGEVVRHIEGSVKKGFHRVSWDLRYPSVNAINVSKPKPASKDDEPTGVMVAPGDFTVSLSKEVDGKITVLSAEMPFKVERLGKGALPGADPKVTAAFWKKLAGLSRQVAAADRSAGNALKRITALQVALSRVSGSAANLTSRLHNIKTQLFEFEERIRGNMTKSEVGEIGKPRIAERISHVATGTLYATYGPSPAHKQSFAIADKEFAALKKDLVKLLSETLPQFEKDLQAAGAPWVEGQPLPN